MEDENFNENGFSLITDFQENSEQDLRYTTINEELPILPLRNMVLFPGTVLPVAV
jgi:ATP-dependent Lon protease